MAEAHPREIDGFSVLRQLGAGGMGTVYLARHPRLGRLDALKVLPEQLAHSEEFRERFLQEAALATKVSHPNLLTVYDQRQADSVVLADGGRLTPADRVLYIDMQYVEGPDLAQLLEQEAPLPVDRVLRLVQQVAAALDALHRNGLVHLDVKPSNVLVVEQDWRSGVDRPLLTDFGIAHVVSVTASLDTASVMGSIAYMAPERLERSARAPASDVYALGVTLYELLTGRLPFDGTYEAIVAGHVALTPPAASSLRPDLPVALDAVLARALAKRPEDRWASAGELAAAALAAVAGQSSGSVPTQPVRSPGRPPGPAPVTPSGTRSATPKEPRPVSAGGAGWALAVAGVVVVGALAVTGWATGVFPPPEPSPSPSTSTEPSAPPTSTAPTVAPDPPTDQATTSGEVRALTGVTPVAGASTVTQEGDSLVMPCASGRSDDLLREVRYELPLPLERLTATARAEGQADPASRLEVEVFVAAEQAGAAVTRRVGSRQLSLGQSGDVDAALGGERAFLLRLRCEDPAMRVRLERPQVLTTR